MNAHEKLLERKPRRIVAGQREDGTSYLARYEEVDRDFRSDGGDPAAVFGTYRLWANDRLPVQLPLLDGRAPLASEPTMDETPEALRHSSPQPGADGLRVSLVKLAPTLPGTSGEFHWHETFDVQLLVSGDLTIMLDDGSELALDPGDAVLQHGTNHAWRTGPEGAVLALFMLGAHRVGVSPPADKMRDLRPMP